MSECDMPWWTLSNVVDWVRDIDPTATIRQIRVALEERCGSGRIRARGHRGVYGYNRLMPIDHRDPTFVQFAEEYGEPRSSFDEISASEWRDLAFFARPSPGINQQYQAALTLALDQLTSPVELRSVSKYRLAWKDVEFWQDDVIGMWPHASDAAEPNEAKCEPRTDAAAEATGGTRLSTSGPAPLSELIVDGCYAVTRYTPECDKIMRMHAQTAMIENSFVRIPQSAPWLAEYLHEMTVFPRGKHDDQVDSTAQFLDWFKKPMPYLEYYELMRLRAEAVAAEARGEKPKPIGNGAHLMEIYRKAREQCERGEYPREAEKLKPPEPVYVRVKAPPGIGSVQTFSGRRNTIGEDRIVEMSEEDANCLIPAG